MKDRKELIRLAEHLIGDKKKKEKKNPRNPASIYTDS
jgi:hypothetical protein